MENAIDQQWDADVAREERASLNYMFHSRILVLALLALWVAITLPLDRSSAYIAVLLLFFLFGAIPYALALRGYCSTQVFAVFLFLDASVLSYLLIFPNPYGLEGWSPQMNLRAPGFLYLGLFLVYMSLSYKPKLVVWAGIAAAVSWSAGYIWGLGLPQTQVFTSQNVLDAGLSLEAALVRVLDPDAVGVARLVNQLVFLAAVTLILTLTVWRSRKLVFRQLALERQRSSLSRYFSPNLVRELTSSRRNLEAPKVQPVAVLFADMVGFTTLSERLAPENLVALLRDFHGRFARIALNQGATIDKFIGDAIMLHFGTPEPRADDAARALRCAAEMLAEVERWNATRTAKDDTPIRVGIGLHYGDVIVGNIGDERRLEYTVLGDTVNVASRLETLTRSLNSPFVTSDALIDAAREAGADPAQVLPNLRPGEPAQVQGRTKPVGVWHLTTPEAEYEVISQ
ncbi:adenylate/guanylate cyclase domain-containing protein [Ruegeria sp.]|uniref:adenylate/guanylate cyclase domain-containing protein n=1 Tax=Ruegeria sp. TaxID=1879320 RepID=UPI003B5CC50E